MTDIVERLRDVSRPPKTNWAMCQEAADEIERLKAVLRYITELDDDSEAPVLARRALEPKP